MRNLLPLVSLASALFLASCETGVSGSPEGDPLMLNDWQATAIDDTALTSPRPVTLSFMEGRASGRSACNLYSGPVDYDGRHIKFGAMISTKMA